MTTFFLLLSATCGMLTFGIHMNIMAGDRIDRPMYVRHPVMGGIPIIFGFLLPTIAIVYAFSLHWLILVVISLAVVLFLSRPLSTIISIILWRNKNLGYKVMYSFVISIVSLIIGITLHYMAD